MARPKKQGIDYFPLDCYDDDKLKFIRIKYKVEGIGIVFELLRNIYSQGYWIKWSDDEAIIFSDTIKSDYEKACAVVDECLKRGIFSKELYDDYSILTSKGIQTRFFEITKRRKDIEIEKKYLLVPNPIEPQKEVNVDNNPVNVDNNPVNVDTMQTKVHKVNQSKVNQSKVNQSKSSESKDSSLFDGIDDRITSHYERKLTRLVENKEIDTPKNWEKYLFKMIQQDNDHIQYFIIEENERILKEEKEQRNREELEYLRKKEQEKSRKNEEERELMKNRFLELGEKEKEELFIRASSFGSPLPIEESSKPLLMQRIYTIMLNELPNYQ